MNTRPRLLGEDHPDTLTSMANLASTYWSQGRLREAGELGGSSHADDDENAWGGSSIHADEHGQPGINLLQSGTVEGGTGTNGSSRADQAELEGHREGSFSMNIAAGPISIP